MSSSYLESLGRRELEPYSNEKLNYEETEPDLSKQVNAQIDENIKDRRQSMADNISLYNQTQSFAKFKGNLASLQGLIPSIAKVKVQGDNFKANRLIIDGIINDYKDEEKKAKFAEITIKEEELNQELENNENEQLGTIDKSRANTPGKIGQDTSGENVGPVEYIALKNRLANEKLQNPINAKNNLKMEWENMFWPMAKDGMTVGGVLWKDTPLDQKDEFIREAAGVFISEYTAKTGITDRALITTFAPIFEDTIKNEITKSVSIEEDAVNKYYQDADDSKTWQYYNNAAKVYKDSGGKVQLSGVFERNTYIKNAATYLKSIGHPEPMREANKQWLLMIKRGIKAKLIDENTLNFLFQYYKFKPDGGGPEVNYETLQPNAVAELRTYFNEQKKGDSVDDQKSAVDYYKELADAGKDIPMDWRQYITDPDLVTVMETLEDNQKKTNLQKENLDTDDIQLIANLADARIKSNPKFKNKLQDYTWLYHKQTEVLRAIGEDFVKIKNKYVNEGGQDVTKANQLAIQDITTKIKNGDYDGDVNLEILETDKLSTRSVIKAVEIYKENKDALYSSEVHDLEEPHLTQVLKYLDPNDDSVTELPGYFYAVANLYDNLSAMDIAHIRLLKTGMIKEPIDRLMQIKDYSMVAPTVRNLLTDKPNATKVLIAASTITSDDELNQFFEKLVTNEAGLHGTVHAHKYSNQWESELPDGRKLGELTNGEVLALLKDDQLSDIGMYGFTRYGLLSVFNEFSDVIDLDAKFDRKSQTYFLMYRFFQKSNESHLIPRRLLKFNEEDQKKFRDLAFSINPAYITPMNNPACLSEEACNELIQIVIPE